MIAIAGGKGGCGKTTTALGVARALLDAGTGVRAIDLDAGMPNLHRMAGVDRTPSLAALADGDAELQRDAHGVGIVPAPRALADVDLPAAIDAIRPEWGVAVLDCPAGAGSAATAPLREADAAILVTTGRPESVEDAAKTGRMARNLGVPVLGAVVPRAERVSRGTAAEIATDRTIAVPTRREPLAAEAVRERHRSVAGWIEAWRSSEDRTTATASPSRRRPQSDDADGGSGGGVPRCPDCGGVITAGTAGTGATRRPDPRSRRSRGPGGTRSSSRGGGAPSDPR